MIEESVVYIGYKSAWRDGGMKILFVARGYPKSENNMLGLFERDQALAMKNLGYDVAYAVLDMRSIRRNRKLGYVHYCDKGLPVFEMNLPLGNLPLQWIAASEKIAIKGLFKHIQSVWGLPDVVHAHFYKIAVGIWDFFQGEHIPVVVTEHASAVANGSLSKKAKRLLKRTYKNVDTVISVSNPLAELISKSYDIQPIVIPNMVVLDNSMTSEKKHARFRFASSANLVHRKGIDILLDAFSQVVQKNKNIELVIYGDGPERKNLERQIKELNLVDYVILYGRYERAILSKEYAKADVFVLPSRKETFGVVYIEAMYCGLPVIATRCGGPEDFVTDDVGILVHNEDCFALADAMFHVIETINDYDREHISEYVYRMFAPEQVALRIEDVYRHVAG